ncbi:MAG: class II glutamine amidotransferase, partial [Bacteroidota bacterium]
MCGIVGAIGTNNVSNLLIKGLKKLEYRGYDSAGIAIIEKSNLEVLKEKGKIENLEDLLKKNPTNANIGIGHTRWATHGTVTVDNAHPHFTDKLALVHNGIIENYKELKEKLTKKGYKFRSDTDTEIIAWLITDFVNQGFTPEASVKKTLEKLDGSFALGIIFKDYEDLLIGA